MTTIGTSSLYSGTINGLNSLDLDTLNVSDLDVNNIDGDYFSINTIECNDLQIDNELDLTANGFITIAKGTVDEITITDTQVGYLDGLTSNIQDQLNTLTTDLNTAEGEIDTLQTDLNTAETNISTLQTDLNTAETNITTLQTKTQNLTATSTDNILTNSTTSFKDSPVDSSITNVLSAFQNFDKNIALMRTNNEYRKYWIGMTGDDNSASNRFAIGCNGVNTDEPEILMELDETGTTSFRNGIKIYDLLGSNIGSINNYSDTPTNSTFSITTSTGNLFFSTPTNRSTDFWTPTIQVGQFGGATINMRQDSGTNRSKLLIQELNLYGGITNQSNSAYINLNGENQNNAYTDADHTNVNKIPQMENDIDALEIGLQTITTSYNNHFYNLNPTGTVLTFAGNSLPTGYLWCNGAEVSQTTYASLYAVIGTTYSTNRKTSPAAGNFFLPDMRGCFVAGAGQPQSSSFNFKITPSSKTVGQFREMSVQDHKHLAIVHQGSVNVSRGGTLTTNVSNDADTQISTFGLNYADNTSFAANTYISAGETQPFNITMNYIIKY